MEQAANQESLMLKQWWRKYAKLIAVALIVFIALAAGVNYWRTNRVHSANAAAQVFQDMVLAELRQDPQTATAKGAQLLSEYSDTPYAQFSGLLLAKIAVNSGDLDQAVEQLQWVADQSSVKDISKHLATVRLSAVLLQQNKLDEALALVAKDPDQAYAALYAQARGDVYVAKNEPEQAKIAYQLAMQSLPDGMQSPVLQMKLLDLGGTPNA